MQFFFSLQIQNVRYKLQDRYRAKKNLFISYLITVAINDLI